MKKMLIPVVAAGLLIALSSISATALAVGGSGGKCDDLLADLKCVGGGGGSLAPGSGGGSGSAFICVDTDCFSGYTSGGGAGSDNRNSDGTVSPGGQGGRVFCDNDVEDGCRVIGGGGGHKP
jgi:hypothetical protein